MDKTTISQDFCANFDWYPKGKQKEKFDEFLGVWNFEVLKRVFDPENGSSITVHGIPLLWKMTLLAREIHSTMRSSEIGKKYHPITKTKEEIDEYKKRHAFFMNEGVKMAIKGASEQEIEGAFNDR